MLPSADNAISSNDYKSYISPGNETLIILFSTTKTKINRAIKKPRNNSACGEGGIKPQPIKSVAHLISVPISHTKNLVLGTGIFPNISKIARVPVIHNRGATNDLKNYTPISVLPIFFSNS